MGEVLPRPLSGRSRSPRSDLERRQSPPQFRIARLLGLGLLYRRHRLGLRAHGVGPHAPGEDRTETAKAAFRMYFDVELLIRSFQQHISPQHSPIAFGRSLGSGRSSPREEKATTQAPTSTPAHPA